MIVTQAARPASSSDIKSAMQVMMGAFPPEYGEGWTEDQLRSTMRLPGVHLFLAKDEGNIAGFALVRMVLDEAELLLIAVLPEWRRKSVAIQLLEFIEACLTDHGMAKLFLEMRKGNPAEMLYRKSGFEQIGYRPDYYRGRDGARYDAITFGKTDFTA